ncbi:hypothetical protein ACKZDW_19415 [Ralstonia syzygii subsp. celebesensis]
MHGRLALPAGQSRRHWLPAGAIIVTLEGRLMLEPPRAGWPAMWCACATP